MEWPEKLPAARMRVSDEEWVKLAPELIRRRICTTLTPDQLIHHNGEVLTAGMFGVSKGKSTLAPDGRLVEVLRLIINLVPSNALQHPLLGDVGTLPHFAQWIGLELLPDERLVWSSEDIQCAFYIFKIQ